MSKCYKLVALFSYFGKAKPILWLLLLLCSALTGSTQNGPVNDSVVKFTNVENLYPSIKQIRVFSFIYAKIPDKHINFGIVGNEYNCIILKLTSTDTLHDQYLSIDNTSLDTINIYKINHDGTSRMLYQGGNLVPFNIKRNYVWHTAPVAISSNPTFYFIAIKASQKNVNLRYAILDSNELQRKYQAYDRVVFFYFGIICIITTIIVLAILLFKKAVFAAYLGYIICASVWILSHYGYIFPFLYPQIPLLNEIIKPVSSLGGSLFLIVVLHLVFRHSLNSFIWLKRIIKCTLGVLLLFIVLMFLLLISSLYLELKIALLAGWHIALLFSIVIIVLTPLFFFNTGYTAKIFSTAMFVICIMSVVQLISNAGYLNVFFINEHGMAFGCLLENSIMAFGLFYSLLEEKKHKEKLVFALEQEQTVILKKLITVQDNERKRIASDLHDNIGPLLAALKINFRRIIHTKDADMQNGLVAKTESIIDDSIAEIRNVAHNLMPKGLSSNGLIDTLTGYFEGLQQLYDKTIVFHHRIQSIFHPDIQINVYRIICELVLNAARHSNAGLIRVEIITLEECISISIYDNGHGFLPKTCDQKRSIGLQSAESRVLYLKGTFILNTEPGKGTLIDMKIPLQFYDTQVHSF